ncbi:MAG: erythromycin esterase family protein [Nannocystis sp.]|nr:erythromycin esterase family protein [Nannocystis sp.]MBA3547103.1 erythromycin esterase family protein [Nannocystis sp.]
MTGSTGLLSSVVGCLLAGCAPWNSEAKLWEPVAGEITAWIEQHAVAIGDGGLDVTPVCDLLAAAPVLGLGESSHGVHELKVAQLAVVKCVAERPGPAMVLFELGYEFGLTMDAYVQGAEALPDLGSGDIVGTHELKEMLDWLRAHNLRVAVEDRVHVGGVDIYCWSRCTRPVIAYLKTVDPARASAAERRLAPMDTTYAQLGPDAAAALLVALAAERDNLIAQRERYQRASDPATWADAVHRLTLARAHGSEAFESFPRGVDRDRLMADNVEWFLASRRADKRVVLIAHSGHIAADAQRLPNDRRAPPSMGEHLRHRLGRDYVAMHMAFGSGEFLTYRANWIGSSQPGFANPLVVFPVDEAPSATLEAKLGARRGAHVLDLRRLPASGPVTTWFEWEQYARSLGNSWRRSFARWPLETVGWTRLRPALAFDLVLYVPTASPIVPL